MPRSGANGDRRRHVARLGTVPKEASTTSTSSNGRGWPAAAARRGNLGVKLITRDLGAGRIKIIALGWWSDVDHIRAFTGEHIELAQYQDPTGRQCGARISHCLWDISMPRRSCNGVLSGGHVEL